MMTLQFADTYSLFVFLSKPTESERFEQIVDFLNANPIRYALTINPTIYTSCIEQFWAIVKAKTVIGEVQLQALVDGKKIIITESIVRRDLQLEDAKGIDCLPNATIFEQLTLMGLLHGMSLVALFESMVKNLENMSDNVADEVVNEEMDDSFERAATTATSVWDSKIILLAFFDDIHVWSRSKLLIFIYPLLDYDKKGKNLDVEQDRGGGTRHQETIGDTIAQTRSKNVSKYSNDPLLAREHKDCSSSGDYKFKTKNQEVREEKRIKNSQAQKIIQGKDMDEKHINVAKKEVSTADPVTTVGEVVTTTSPTKTTTADDLTLAQTLIEIRSAKSKVKGVVIGEQSKFTTRTIPQQLPSKDKGKGIMEEPEKPTKKKDQIRHDEEVAQRLQAQMQAKLEEEDRLVR
ncbi:hypothetical protein Tco_0097789 [Tanacetum coccineum]